MLRKIWFASILMFLPLAAEAQVDDGGDVVSQGAKQFVDQFWSEWSGPNATALPYIKSAVSDPINFYGQSMTRAAFMKAEIAFMNRWPDRHYAVQRTSESVNCYPDDSRCEVNGIVAWNDDSPDRGVASKGTTAFDFTLDYQAVGGKVIYHLSKETGTDNVTSFGAITTGVVASPALQLPDSAVQNLGCLDDDLHEMHENCTLAGGFDLTAAYHTTAKWELAITQLPAPPYEGNLQFIFLKNGSAVQISANPKKFVGVHFSGQNSSFCRVPNTLWDVSLVFPTKDAHWPIIVANAACFTGAPNQPKFTEIWTYNRSYQDFEMILGSITQCSEDARLFTSGLLAGDFVADIMPPYSNTAPSTPRQLIDVYRLEPDQAFHKVLNFSENPPPWVNCAERDPDEILDGDLPKVFARLGLWHH